MPISIDGCVTVLATHRGVCAVGLSLEYEPVVEILSPSWLAVSKPSQGSGAGVILCTSCVAGPSHDEVWSPRTGVYCTIRP